MKNIKLGIKLLGGFLLSSLIVLVVGLLSIVQQGKLAQESEQLGSEALPAIQNILVVKSQAATIASLMRSYLVADISKSAREESNNNLLAARKVYGAAKEKFAALPILSTVQNEWQDFNTHIGKWVAANNQVVEISKELSAQDILNPMALKEDFHKIEIAHNELLLKLNSLLLSHTPFEGGTDESYQPDQCPAPFARLVET